LPPYTFEAYFSALIEERRRTPGDDLLTKLTAAESEEGKLSHEELISNAVLLLAAGYETTTNLLGNGLLALLSNPDQWRRLREEPGIAANATEELLRYDSPVQMATPRVADHRRRDRRPRHLRRRDTDRRGRFGKPGPGALRGA
jgi:cytochrome P450